MNLRSEVNESLITFELTSSNRNRRISENPFLFEVTLNNTGQQNNGIQAYDPITYQLPFNIGSVPSLNTNQLLLQWTGLDVSISGTILAINVDEIIISFTTAFSVEYNYYRGLLGIFSSGNWSRVLEYIYLGNSQGLFKVNLPEVVPAIGSVFTSTFNSTITVANKVFSIFVPKTMRHNALAGLYVYNETLNEGKLISTYASKRAEALISSGPVSWSNDHTYSIRRELPIVTPVVTSTSNTVNVAVANGIVFPGDFLLNQTTKDLVTVINVSAGLLTFTPGVSSPWIAGQNVEILKFQKDNYNYMTYSNLQREVFTGEYEVTLISLNLPKERLNTDFTIEKMPFVYLEIRDTFNPSTNSFMSNNPGSKKALFKATLKKHTWDDPFVKFSGDKATRVIKFRPSAANFVFSVLDYNGEPLKLWRKDTVSPFPPNKLLQAEAFLNIKKIDDKMF